MSPRIVALLLLAALAWWSWPRDAGAEIKRCRTPSGDPLYTDKERAALGLTDPATRFGAQRVPDDVFDTARAQFD